MLTPFADFEKATREIAVWEKHRIEFALDMATRGQRPDPDTILLGGWRTRAVLLAGAADVWAVLSRNERAVRAIVPALAVAADSSVPSLWSAPASSTGR
jgi:hypothetical protein